jgi:hypothetical protein
MTLQLEGVEILDSNSIAVFEFVTEVWFKEYYNGVNGSDRNRKLAFGDGIAGVNGMETTVTYRDQAFTAADATANREFPTNVITYDQQITYFATSNAPSSRQILLMPFEDTGVLNTRPTRLVDNAALHWYRSHRKTTTPARVVRFVRYAIAGIAIECRCISRGPFWGAEWAVMAEQGYRDA